MTARRPRGAAGRGSDPDAGDRRFRGGAEVPTFHGCLPRSDRSSTLSFPRPRLAWLTGEAGAVAPSAAPARPKDCGGPDPAVAEPDGPHRLFDARRSTVVLQRAGAAARRKLPRRAVGRPRHGPRAASAAAARGCAGAATASRRQSVRRRTAGGAVAGRGKGRSTRSTSAWPARASACASHEARLAGLGRGCPRAPVEDEFGVGSQSARVRLHPRLPLRGEDDADAGRVGARLVAGAVRGR
jgi:hypothetical protein